MESQSGHVGGQEWRGPFDPTAFHDVTKKACNVALDLKESGEYVLTNLVTLEKVVLRSGYNWELLKSDDLLSTSLFGVGIDAGDVLELGVDAVLKQPLLQCKSSEDLYLQRLNNTGGHGSIQTLSTEMVRHRMGDVTVHHSI